MADSVALFYGAAPLKDTCSDTASISDRNSTEIRPVSNVSLAGKRPMNLFDFKLFFYSAEKEIVDD
ncbi:hypothetical protein [Haloarcula salina]|uniref:Uncharacterized protein n=1 Tax=Haloarcula salina TaxID=1429914 RepID=A0AA41FZA5_9EURY|nr:hypothetical protein [Haloarcula salina]MBV0900408.1 hypothetical protein [Haloarcula salina]